jgi:hypothetical protein
MGAGPLCPGQMYSSCRHLFSKAAHSQAMTIEEVDAKELEEAGEVAR